MKPLVYTTAILALLAAAGFAHAQDSATTVPTARPPAECPAPGSVPGGELPANCKAANQNSTTVEPNAQPAKQDAITVDPGAKPVDQTEATGSTGTIMDSIDPTSAFLASKFIGQTVYSAANENVGEINDMIMDKNGGVVGVIVGVGGFLGIGEKDVVVPLSKLTTAKAENNALKLTISSTREELEAAPAFDRSKLSLAAN
jgi:sporulation protein YlmC with PRC-barrel domain